MNAIGWWIISITGFVTFFALLVKHDHTCERKWYAAHPILAINTQSDSPIGATSVDIYFVGIGGYSRDPLSGDKIYNRHYRVEEWHGPNGEILGSYRYASPPNDPYRNGRPIYDGGGGPNGPGDW